MSWKLVEDLSREHSDDAEFSSRLDERFSTNAVVAISDMSGFSTRTRNYGIAHVFRLFLDLDAIVRPVVARRKGASTRGWATTSSCVLSMPRP